MSKYGSGLDIAEIELNVMTRQCLSRRIESIDILRTELIAWESGRNNLLKSTGSLQQKMYGLS